MSDDKVHSSFHVREKSIRWGDDANGFCLWYEILLLIFLRDAEVYLVEFRLKKKTTFKDRTRIFLGSYLKKKCFPFIHRVQASDLKYFYKLTLVHLLKLILSNLK